MSMKLLLVFISFSVASLVADELLHSTDDERVRISPEQQYPDIANYPTHYNDLEEKLEEIRQEMETIEKDFQDTVKTFFAQVSEAADSSSITDADLLHWNRVMDYFYENLIGDAAVLTPVYELLHPHFVRIQAIPQIRSLIENCSTFTGKEDMATFHSIVNTCFEATKVFYKNMDNHLTDQDHLNLRNELVSSLNQALKRIQERSEELLNDTPTVNSVNSLNFLARIGQILGRYTTEIPFLSQVNKDQIQSIIQRFHALIESNNQQKIQEVKSISSQQSVSIKALRQLYPYVAFLRQQGFTHLPSTTELFSRLVVAGAQARQLASAASRRSKASDVGKLTAQFKTMRVKKP